MFRKLTDRISSAAASVIGSPDDVRTLTEMGFPEESATNALQATNGDVDRAAELLLAQGPPAAHQQQPIATTNGGNQSQNGEDETLQRVMQESLETEQRRQRQQQTAMTGRPFRTAPTHKAGEAAMLRANGKKPVKTGLSDHHPDVKVIPKLQDKSKEEQILRCADRLKSSPQAVDTLYRALTTIQNNPNDSKFRKIDKTTAGYKRSLENAPGAEDLLLAMSFRKNGNTALVLDRSMVDPALLYLGVTALEQTKLTEEYQEGKRKAEFVKQVKQIMLSSDSSQDEAIKRAAFLSKCPSEPTGGRGALMQVVIADETVRRRFHGDDTLSDVLNWLGGHGSLIPEMILSRDWSLVDLNRYPIVPIDCDVNKNQTLQYIGCWPSGRLEIRPSTESWKRGSIAKPGSSRGLGSAPRDAM